MLVHHLNIAFRNLIRSKAYSVINITGLAVGLSVTMLIGMWVYDELTFNHYHTNHHRIAQVFQHQTINHEIQTTAAPAPVATELKVNYKSDFKHVVRAWWWESAHIISIDDKKILKKGSFMDPEALEMFSFRMLQGSWKSLQDPASVVLSQSTAKALFGDEDPINQNLRIGNLMDARVAGVYEDIPHNSILYGLGFIASWEFWVSHHDWMQAEENDWSTSIMTFVETNPAKTFEALSNQIKDLKRNNIDRTQAAKENPQIFLYPMDRWHLYDFKNGVEVSGRMKSVWMFGTIGVFVLILACVNFMNLSTAQSERRAKEVGVRKSIGSVRFQLINQFLSESFITVLVAFVVAIGIASVCLPLFNELADKEINMPWNNVTFWLVSLFFVCITAMLAGSYPAFYLSSFQPVKVLKGTFKAGRLAALPRRILVVLQFSVSIVLVIGTITVWQQVNFAKNRPVGYTREGLIMVRKNSPEFWGKFNSLKNELKASGAVLEVAESSSPATDIWFNSSGFTWRGKDPDMQDDFATVAVTHDYGKTMGWNFIEGRDFSKEFATDSSALVLNRTAARLMGLENPVDEEIIWNGKKHTVIGVIEDMIMDSPYKPVKQTIFHLNYEGNVWINVRINPELSTAQALSKIEGVFNKLFPSVPFDYKFTDQEYASKFSAEQRTGKLASLFSILAVFISGLGLFGLASFVAEQRKKEIGIRKILGASVANLWKMLSSEFVKLVLIACVVASPIAWHLLNEWLDAYEYRTDVSFKTFVVVTLGALSITIITVSYQTIRSALGDPVKSLRSE
jgi:putative ABC transport system permease protein